MGLSVNTYKSVNIFTNKVVLRLEKNNVKNSGNLCTL